MKNIRIAGMITALILIGSCFLNWAWYPDLEKFFTGYFTEKGYYGKPGVLLSIIAVFALLTSLIPRGILSKINIVFAAIGLAYGIKSFILYSGGYDGYLPVRQPGIYIMLISTIANLFIAIVLLNESNRIDIAKRDGLSHG